jgi:hypothetical protein
MSRDLQIGIDGDFGGTRPARTGCLEAGQLGRQLVGSPEVVVVTEGHPSTTGGFDADISGRSRTATTDIAEQPNPRVAQLSCHRAGRPGRTVLDEEYLEIHRLNQDRVESLAEFPVSLAGGHDHRDQRRHCRTDSSKATRRPLNRVDYGFGYDQR